MYALQDDHSSTSSLNDHLYLGDFADEVRSRCCPLVKVARVGENQTVKLVHQSVKEFFLKGDHHDHPFTLEPSQVHLEIFLACLTFLSFKDFTKPTSYSNPTEVGEEDLRMLEEHPFLRYSALYWPKHLEHVHDYGLPWEKFLHWIGSEESMNFSFRIFWYSEGRDPFPRNTSPMHILCYFGLNGLIRRAFSARQSRTAGCKPAFAWASADIRDSVGRTPLHWAAANGYHRVVSTLLDNDANPGAEAPGNDGLMYTALDFAVDYGHMDVVQLLFSRVGNHGEYIKWLEMASAGGHVELVKMIFGFGVDVNIPVGDYGSALHAAAYKDHAEVARWLLENGADVNLNHGQHGTPLQAAAFEGNLDIVKLLLDNKANVNAGGGIHGSPLQAAAYRDWQAIALELIHRDANVNAEGGEHGNALEAARFSDHLAMMEILKSSGAVSTGSAPLRRASQLDKATIYGIGLVEKEIKKGRIAVVERRAEKLIKQFLDAVATRNGRSLDVLLQIGLNLFQLAVRSGHEGFQLLIVRTAMMILQAAVKKEYCKGVETLSKLYTTALTFALDERKPQLVERLLSECVKGIKSLIDDGKDGDAEDLTNAGIEIFSAVIESRNEQLIEIMARQWVEVVEGLLSGTFEKNLLQVIEGFACKLIAAVEKRDTAKVSILARMAKEALFAAVSGKRKRAVRCLSNLFAKYLQQIFDYEPSDVATWLCDEAKLELFQVDAPRVDEGQVKIMLLFWADFLLATESAGRQGRDCQTTQTRLLELSVPYLKAAEDAGLLGVIEQTIRALAYERLDDCGDETHIRILAGDISRVIDAITEAHHSTELGKALSRAKEALKSTVDWIITSKWR